MVLNEGLCDYMLLSLLYKALFVQFHDRILINVLNERIIDFIVCSNSFMMIRGSAIFNTSKDCNVNEFTMRI